MGRQRGVLFAIGLIVVVAGLLVFTLSSPPEVATVKEATLDAGTVATEQAAKLDALRRLAPAVADGGVPTATRTDGNVLAELGWGSGDNELGRDRPDEANPEAPMSLTVDAQGNVWVLDQVNARLVKLDKTGKRVGATPLTVQAAQDVAIAADGTAVVMDRLVDKSIALVGADGKLRGELKIEGKGLEEGGAATGVFTSGDDVYVEREHGDLVKVGTTKGVSDPERPEVPGRPSRDGTAFLSAGIVDGPGGAVMVTAIERSSQAHRFTRQYVLGAHVIALNLLDSDRSGIIYLGSVIETPESTEEAPRFAVSLLCLDPLDGRPLGRTMLPANGGPEETFRELAVQDEGGVLYLLRSEQGPRVVRYVCGQ